MDTLPRRVRQIFRSYIRAVASSLFRVRTPPSFVNALSLWKRLAPVILESFCRSRAIIVSILSLRSSSPHLFGFRLTNMRAWFNA